MKKIISKTRLNEFGDFDTDEPVEINEVANLLNVAIKLGATHLEFQGFSSNDELYNLEIHPTIVGVETDEQQKARLTAEKEEADSQKAAQEQFELSRLKELKAKYPNA